MKYCWERILIVSCQGDRKGRPYYTTKRLGKAVYSRSLLPPWKTLAKLTAHPIGLHGRRIGSIRAAHNNLRDARIGMISRQRPGTGEGIGDRTLHRRSRDTRALR